MLHCFEDALQMDLGDLNDMRADRMITFAIWGCIVCMIVLLLSAIAGAYLLLGIGFYLLAVFVSVLMWYGDGVAYKEDENQFEKRSRFYESRLFEGLIAFGLISIVFWTCIVGVSDAIVIEDVLSFLLIPVGVIQIGMAGILIRGKSRSA